MALTPLYTIQPAFTSGEISDEVNSRVDIEQYKSALLLAQNAVIRPFGAVCKRQGSQYIGAVKYNDKPVRLEEFTTVGDISFLLEFGVKYLRVYKLGTMIVEIETVFDEADIPQLNFNQSADVLFICSGNKPVQALRRIDDAHWTIGEYVLNPMPFEDINADTDAKVRVDDGKIYATVDLFHEGMVGNQIKVFHKIPMQNYNESSKPYERVIGHDEDHKNFYNKSGAIYERVNGDASATSTVPDYEIDEGKLAWSITTHGTWTDTVTLQTSEDNGKTWLDYRIYKSKDDTNVVDSGTFTNTYTTSRVITNIPSGTNTFEYKIHAHTAFGIVRIKKYISPREAEIEYILKPAKDTETHLWQIGSFGASQGYPEMSAFFQDRLIFANTKRYPNKIWMSRTGDYPNFGIEKASGTLTDDSAITLSIINRKLFSIHHLVPATDLIILTDGNEWIISGSNTVTPSTVSVRIQTQFGTSTTQPQYIGNRCVFVTNRGNNVRDMAYDYTRDGYSGNDLSILSKDNLRNVVISKSTYMQNPDSIICYVGDDGVIRCMTYIAEERVNGWSHYVTDGKYIECEVVTEAENDTLYVVAERIVDGETKRYIEKIEALTTYAVDDNVFLDSFVHKVHKENVSSIDVNHLIGKRVTIVVDGVVHPKQTVPADGIVRLMTAGKDILVGLDYEFKIKQPAFEMQLHDGTIQGRFMRLNGAILRLVNSKGGQCGHNFDMMDDIELIDEDGLYTGDYAITFPQGSDGFNEQCYLCIKHSDPYPFNLKAIIRNLSYGGGKHENINRGL